MIFILLAWIEPRALASREYCLELSLFEFALLLLFEFALSLFSLLPRVISSSFALYIGAFSFATLAISSDLLVLLKSNPRPSISIFPLLACFSNGAFVVSLTLFAFINPAPFI